MKIIKEQMNFGREGITLVTYENKSNDNISLSTDRVYISGLLKTKEFNLLNENNRHILSQNVFSIISINNSKYIIQDKSGMYRIIDHEGNIISQDYEFLDKVGDFIITECEGRYNVLDNKTYLPVSSNEPFNYMYNLPSTQNYLIVRYCDKVNIIDSNCRTVLPKNVHSIRGIGTKLFVIYLNNYNEHALLVNSKLDIIGEYHSIFINTKYDFIITEKYIDNSNKKVYSVLDEDGKQLSDEVYDNIIIANSDMGRIVIYNNDRAALFDTKLNQLSKWYKRIDIVSNYCYITDTNDIISIDGKIIKIPDGFKPFLRAYTTNFLLIRKNNNYKALDTMGNVYRDLIYKHMGSRNDTLHIIIDDNDKILEVYTGCFSGTLSEFEKTVKSRHEDNKYAKAYNKIIKRMRERFTEI